MIESNHEKFGHPKQMKLMKSETKVKCHKIQRIFWHYLLRKDYFPESQTYHLILLFYSFRSKNKLLSKFSFCIKTNFSKLVFQVKMPRIIASDKILKGVISSNINEAIKTFYIFPFKTNNSLANTSASKIFRKTKNI